jgi:hypothetical protein
VNAGGVAPAGTFTTHSIGNFDKLRPCANTAQGRSYEALVALNVDVIVGWEIWNAQCLLWVKS